MAFFIFSFHGNLEKPILEIPGIVKIQQIPAIKKIIFLKLRTMKIAQWKILTSAKLETTILKNPRNLEISQICIMPGILVIPGIP